MNHGACEHVVKIDTSDIAAFRKHLPLSIKSSIPAGVTGEPLESKKLSRKVDFTLLSMDGIARSKELILNGRVNEGYEMLSQCILEAVPEVENNGENNFSFRMNPDCARLRRRVVHLLKLLPSHPHLRAEYNNAKKSFKQSVKDWKESEMQRRESLLLTEVEKRPWKLNPKRNGMFSCPIPLDTWPEHFSSLLNPPNACFYKQDEIPEEWLENGQPELNCNFSILEIEEALRSCNRAKAVGLDKIANEHMQAVFDITAETWKDLFNVILSTGEVVSSWKSSIIKVLYKGKGEVGDVKSYRGIALLSHVFKLLTKMLANRIMSFVELNGLPDEQYGFRKGRSTCDAIRILRDAVTHALSEQSTSLYAVFVDFRAAFDVVPRDLLIEKLVRVIGIKGRIIKLLSSIYSQNKIRVFDGLSFSEEIVQSRGVLQGDSLSPLMFILYVSDLPNLLSGVGDDMTSVLYADDLVLFSRSHDLTQRALDVLSSYCETFKVNVNLSKTKAIKFRRGGRLSSDDELFYNMDKVNFVNEYDYLGVTVQPRWTFTKHLKRKRLKMVTVMNTAPSLGKRLQELSVGCAVRFFDIMLKPILCYGLEAVWPDLKSCHYKLLDSAKWYFFKRVLGLSKFCKNRYVSLLLGLPLLTEQFVAKSHEYVTYSWLIYKSEVELKLIDVPVDFFASFAMCSNEWMKSGFVKRHLLTRYSVHGFHSKFCMSDVFHERCATCICLYCNEYCGDLNHGRECIYLKLLSLSELNDL